MDLIQISIIGCVGAGNSHAAAGRRGGGQREGALISAWEQDVSQRHHP